MKCKRLLAAFLLFQLILCAVVCAQTVEIRPHEPTETTESKPVPVWQFCHGLRDGLESAVIKGYLNDCEAGPGEYEMTPEEIGTIRAIAINGVVTGKASDLSVTGGTWTYSFETPDGQYLFSIEMYKGWIVGSDGMYNFRE